MRQIWLDVRIGNPYLCDMETADKSLPNSDPFEKLIGTHPKFRRVIEDAKSAARTDFTVLIFGKTGTGKSLIAEGIHKASNRRSSRFVAVDLGLIPHETQDAELFGYVPGAFTGASKGGRDGLIADAHNGTLFFDEVGDASEVTQSKLLRLFQERTIRKMGSNKETPLDIRIIAATNQNIKRLMQNGEFREDLYYRLKVIVLNVPSLFERGREDFEQLIDHFVSIHNLPERQFSISPEARDFLWEYPLRWPGNVRELEATLQRLMALSSKDVITREEARSIIDRQVTPDEREQMEMKSDYRQTLEGARDQIEKRQLEQVLMKHNGNRKKAAEELGKSTRTLSRLTKKHNLWGK